MLTANDIKEDVKLFLDLDQTEEYDAKLILLINAALGKMETEGLPNIITKDHSQYQNYLIALCYNVAQTLDIEVDLKVITNMYHNIAIPLRAELKRYEQTSSS